MKKLIVIFSFVFCSGCATLWDAPKNIVGFSTKDMEDARSESLYQSYQGDFLGIFQAIIEIANENKYYVFSQDEVRGMAIIMNIPGAVDTTEVGVFLTSLDTGNVKVELSSRSAPAKKTVAQVLFLDLGKKFKKI
ncbi:MAG: hypothetical protein HQL21_02670 [Candidatus Omnitrophica bacterium]|nr:hypothetical protein [Candidatus Omnitrophota bacterium]